MNPMTQTLIAAVATVAALAAGAAHADARWGHEPLKLRIDDSFNTSTSNYRNQVDNSRRSDTRLKYDYDLTNNLRYKLNNNFDYDLRYNLNQDKIAADQKLMSKRNYNSSVGQNAANVGSASGHGMNQYQGGTNVGALVSESNTSNHTGHSLLSPSFSTRYGDSGTLDHSQIGGIQSGFQGGDVTNAQGNEQRQKASSYVGSVDTISNTATK